MNASKEEACKALGSLVALSDALGSELRNKHSAKIIAIQEFIEAAGRKLPSEHSYAKDKARRLASKKQIKAL